MKSLSKVVLLAGIMAFAVLLTGRTNPASALPTSLTINGGAVGVTAAVGSLPQPVVVGSYTDDATTADFVLTSSAAAGVGVFFAPVVTANNDGQIVTGNSTTTITVTDDVDLVSEPTAVTVTFVCLSAGVTNISFTQGGAAIAAPLTITCTTASAITLSSTSAIVNGTAVTVTVPCAAAGQILTATLGVFGTPTANGTLASATQANCVAAATNMIVPFTCSAAGTVTFTSNAQTATLTCTGAVAGGLVLSSTTGYTATVSGTCVAGQLLTFTGAASFTAATINGAAVAVGPASISCTGAGPIVATFTCNSTGYVYFNLGGLTGTFSCNPTGGYGGYGAGYNPYLNAYPNTCGTTGYNGYNGAYPYNGYNNGAYPYNGTNGAYPYNGYNAYNTTNTNCYNGQQVTNNVATSLTIAAGSPSVACGANSTVTVKVMAANGQNVADGTSVSLAASVGTLSPATATTTGGAVTATYTAPSNVPATSVTLKAIAGAASNTTGVSVTCATTAAPSTTAPVQPPYYSPAAPPTGLVISPPNTGDAGLKALDVNCDD